MSNSIIKYEKFFPEKVYYCLCLENAVNEIFNKQIHSYTEMMLAISECCVGDARVFCTRANEKKDCLVLCQPHLLITMMVAGKFDGTSANEKDIAFSALQKRYCRSCVRHYCQKLCNTLLEKILCKKCLIVDFVHKRFTDAHV